MVHQRVTRINHRAAIGITHGIISRLAAVPPSQHTFNVLLWDAVADTVYQSRQRDIVSLSLISNNQPFGYLHLILRWAAGTEIKAQHVVREAVQPVDHQPSKSRNGQRVIFQYNYPAWLLSGPLNGTPMIPVCATATVINKQMSIQQRRKSLRMTYARVMANNAELNICQHHYG
ncbi:hypothetical protein A3N46_02890 [Enterobacter asburiae]|nr:hypothetical protein A3N46_02890 [Enterobacter asburiae]